MPFTLIPRVFIHFYNIIKFIKVMELFFPSNLSDYKSGILALFSTQYIILRYRSCVTNGKMNA